MYTHYIVLVFLRLFLYIMYKLYILYILYFCMFLYVFVYFCIFLYVQDMCIPRGPTPLVPGSADCQPKCCWVCRTAPKAVRPHLRKWCDGERGPSKEQLSAITRQRRRQKHVCNILLYVKI